MSKGKLNGLCPGCMIKGGSRLIRLGEVTLRQFEVGVEQEEEEEEEEDELIPRGDKLVG